jgi:hypothetical protein
MAKEEPIRAVRRVIGLVEALIGAFARVADELAKAEDEVADATMVNTASDRLASAKTALRGRSLFCVSGRKTRTTKMTRRAML